MRHWLSRPACAILPPSLYERLKFRILFGVWPDLGAPAMYNEMILAYKLQSLEGGNVLLSQTADKVGAKEYIRERVGDAHTIPLLYTGTDPRSFPLDSLPRPYIVKPSNSCGDVIMVRSEEDLANREGLMRIMESWSEGDYGRWINETFYRDIPFAILAEPLLESDGKLAPEFKFEVFQGRANLFYVESGRFRRLRRGMYGRDLHFLGTGFGNAENSPFTLPGRKTMDRMFHLAEILSEGFPMVRIDMFLHRERIFIGEITHFPGSGQSPLQDMEEELLVGHVLRHGTVPQRCDLPRKRV